MSISKTFLALGISIFFFLFVAYALFTFYQPPPNLEMKDTNCSMNCSKLAPKNFSVRVVPDKFTECLDKEQECLSEARIHSPRFRNKEISFFILLTVGLGAIVFGIYFSKMEGIGSGFIGGGILTLIWSLIYTAEYWTTMSRYFKLAAIGITLLILIFLGYKRMDKQKL